MKSTSCFLSSSIINKLSEENSASAIAYFFFDGRDSQNALQLHDNLIRSLISQFCHQRGGIPAELADLYKHCGDHQPSASQLQNTLQDILNGFSHAYLIIDALDECSNREREKTLNWITTLVVDWKVKNLHIAVTSRPELDIKKVLGALDHSIDVGETTENQDILKYLQRHIESKFEAYNEITRKKVESTLRERAEGSYVYLYHLFSCS